VPTPVVHTRLRAPASKMEPAANPAAAAQASPLQAKYGTRVDRESAAELLAARVERAADAAETEKPKAKTKPAPAPKPAQAGDPVTDFLRSRQGKALQREVVRGVFGMLKKRL